MSIVLEDSEIEPGPWLVSTMCERSGPERASNISEVDSRTYLTLSPLALVNLRITMTLGAVMLETETSITDKDLYSAHLLHGFSDRILIMSHLGHPWLAVDVQKTSSISCRFWRR